jgi:predicted metal-dependent peptidase
MQDLNQQAAAAVKAALADAEKKMRVARTSLLIDPDALVFFSSLALSLKLKVDTTCQTAWVDGQSIGFNPSYILGLTHKVRIALIAHEVFHPALFHCWRRDGRDPLDGNIACDKVINPILRDAGFEMMPDIYYAEGAEVGKSAEWIYSHMQQAKQSKPQDQPQGNPKPQDDEDDAQDGQDEPQDGQGDGEEGQEDSEGQPGQDGQEQPQDGDSDGQGEGQDGQGDGEGQPGAGQPVKGQPKDLGTSMGDVRDAPVGVDADGDEAASEDEWKERVAVAHTQAQMAGQNGGGMGRVIEDALAPEVDVRSLLLKFMQERTFEDSRWTRPSRRYLASGMILPSIHSEGLGEVAIMVDTSGSIDDLALREARTIVQSVIDECRPLRVSMYMADARVCRVDRFEQGEPLVWEPCGGGGTNFCPALEAIERDEAPVCVICITDLCGTFPEDAPSIPVMWLSTNFRHLEAPFGETVYVGE